MDRIFGTVIRQLREEKKLSQNKAAQRAGMSQSQWSRLEDGLHWPTERGLARVGKGLDITPKEFFNEFARFISSRPKSFWDGVDWDSFLPEKDE